jgi:hypothetical protein
MPLPATTTSQVPDRPASGVALAGNRRGRGEAPASGGQEARRSAAARAGKARPGGALWRHIVRAGARAVSCVGARVYARAGGALAAPAPQALLSRFLA